MRDKERIPKVLKELEKIWKSNPDLRLGQIIVIATKPVEPSPEVFHIEDDDILKGIQAINKKNDKAENNNKTPYWEVFPDIIRIEVEEISLRIIEQFIKVVEDKEPNLIISAKSMMKLVGAPISDKNWLNKHKKRFEKINSFLKELEKNGYISAVEIGYKVNK